MNLERYDSKSIRSIEKAMGVQLAMAISVMRLHLFDLTLPP
jgi:hypothetical protein